MDISKLKKLKVFPSESEIYIKEKLRKEKFRLRVELILIKISNYFMKKTIPHVAFVRKHINIQLQCGRYPKNTLIYKWINLHMDIANFYEAISKCFWSDENIKTINN